jgi:hypothetical protein
LLLSPFVRMHWLAILLFVSKPPSQTHQIFVQPDLSRPRSKCLSPATTERNGTMNVQKPPSTKTTPKQGMDSSNNKKTRHQLNAVSNNHSKRTNKQCLRHSPRT